MVVSSFSVISRHIIDSSGFRVNIETFTKKSIEMYNSFDTTNGGGFVNETASQSSTGKKKEQTRRIQSVVPLLISHITNCKDEEFSLHGFPVQIADIVGILKKFEIQSTKATCTIQDLSGVIKAILWLETENDCVTGIPAVKEDCYVRVFGSIRTQDGEKILMILKMVPVDDLNVITNHRLQMIHVRLYTQKLAEGSLPDASMAASYSTGATASGMSFSDMKMDAKENPHALTPIQLEVIQQLNTVQDCTGLSKSQVLERFPSGKAREVMAALHFLLDEGHAYTTVDNEHYKATDGL